MFYAIPGTRYAIPGTRALNVVHYGRSKKKNRLRLQPQYLVRIYRPVLIVFLIWVCIFLLIWLREPDQLSFLMFISFIGGKPAVGWPLGLGTLCHTHAWMSTRPLCWELASLKHRLRWQPRVHTWRSTWNTIPGIILNCLKKWPLRAKIYIQQLCQLPAWKIISHWETRGCPQDDPWRPQYVPVLYVL